MTFSPQMILTGLDLLIAGTLTYERLQVFRDQLAEMAALAQEPTPEQWDALFASIDQASAEIDAADKRLNRGELK